jgi:hypothetical protein
MQNLIVADGILKAFLIARSQNASPELLKAIQIADEAQRSTAPNGAVETCKVGNVIYLGDRTGAPK